VRLSLIQLRTGSAMGQRWQVVRDFMYGLAGYPFVRHAREMKHEAEALFMLVTLGDLVGVPIMPPIYSLRLLPHVAPQISQWKRQLARKKEFWEKEEYDLHGV